MSHQFKEFTVSLKIRLLNSSPYYAQAIGEAESSNKILIKPKALWAHRVSKHGATKVTPFELVYGQEAVLPVEVNLQACRVAKQNALSIEEYKHLMMDKIDETPESRFRALREIERGKLQTAKAYKRRVKEKSFQISELVWKMILPLGTRINRFGKWSSTWEGHYRVIGIVPGNAYMLETVEGRKLAKAINGKYIPSMWQGA
jgi:hypothetical protein